MPVKTNSARKKRPAHADVAETMTAINGTPAFIIRILEASTRPDGRDKPDWQELHFRIREATGVHLHANSLRLWANGAKASLETFARVFAVAKSMLDGFDDERWQSIQDRVTDLWFV